MRAPGEGQAGGEGATSSDRLRFSSPCGSSGVEEGVDQGGVIR